jgi:hypothetical protein
MARVTRSKKIEVSEDHTAIVTQTPLPNTPQKRPEALAEIQNTMGTANLAMDDNTVAKELKNLKAAYRNAIGGGKRGKKPKGRKKDKQDSQADSEETLDSQEHALEDGPESASNLVPEATYQLLQSREGSLAPLFVKTATLNLTQSSEDLSASQQQQTKPAAAGRTTRRQMAIAQAGQYNMSTSSSSNGSQDLLLPSMTQKFRGLDFISLFGGRSAGSSRSNNGTASGRSVFSGEFLTDYHLSLAKEELSKSMREATVEVVAVDSSTEVEDVADRYDTKDTTASHTPGKSPVKTLQEVERACPLPETTTPAEDEGEDSFVKQITCRSPAKPVSRIEDSVEALDKLEEALEALDQVAMAERILSSEELKEKVARVKARDSVEPREKRKIQKEPEVKGSKKQISTKEQPVKPGYASMRVKPTAPKQPVVKKASSMIFKSDADGAKPNEEVAKAQPLAKAPVKRPASLLPPKEPIKSAKQPTRPTFQLPGETVAQKLKEQREARRAQRESSEDTSHAARVVSGPKIKSTKPPTKPTFVLPGELVSQRKREAHEAKLRAQEEEERKRREFKAKPIRNSIAPDFVPRETVASLARRSKIGVEGMDLADFAGSKRCSIIGAHRPSLAQATMANISAPRTKAPVPVRKTSPTTHGPSMSGRALHRSVSVTDVQVQRQRAKEIYNRDNKMTEEIEREKREREAAAKRAREEAAERGRQASREWAEKQLAKKMAAGDKGLSAGYGPGGQMGLKA